MNKLLLALLFLSAGLAPVLAPGPAFGADEGFSSLEEQMTGQDFKAAGLDKLTPQELEALNGWIRRRSLATLDAPSGGAAASAAESPVADRRGLKGEKEDLGPGGQGQVLHEGSGKPAGCNRTRHVRHLAAEHRRLQLGVPRRAYPVGGRHRFLRKSLPSPGASRMALRNWRLRNNNTRTTM